VTAAPPPEPPDPDVLKPDDGPVTDEEENESVVPASATDLPC
jgi:hypothetical protein